MGLSAVARHSRPRHTFSGLFLSCVGQEVGACWEKGLPRGRAAGGEMGFATGLLLVHILAIPVTGKMVLSVCSSSVEWR